MPAWRWWTVAILSFLVVGYAAFMAVMVALGVELSLPLPTTAYRIALGTHITAGIVALAAMPLQFSVKLRQRRPALHRALGKWALAAILVGGVAALASAALSPSSLVARAGFTGMAIAWLVTGWFAWRYAVAKRFKLHRAWVLRAFAVTLAAVTLRIELPLLIIAFQGDFDRAYAIVAWLSWIPNILVAEWILRSGIELPDATPAVARA